MRDRIFGLLTDLCGREHDVSPDGLRLLSHTLMGVARDDAPGALLAVRDALPWIAAFLEASDGAAADAVAQLLVRRGAVRALTCHHIERRLHDARTPAAWESRLRELAALDLRVVTASLLSEQAIRDTVIEDSALLSAVVDVCAEPEADQASRFRRAVNPAPAASATVAVLSELENSWNASSLCGSRFSERSVRFEISAADHLARSGFMPAVRAALIYGPERVAEWVPKYSLLQAEPAMADLAVALGEARGACVHGAMSARGFDGWIDYLRGPNRRLASAHRITTREAMSFAHFCLHLVNFCDLVANDMANDAARDRMMELEAELREVTAGPSRLRALPEAGSP